MLENRFFRRRERKPELGGRGIENPGSRIQHRERGGDGVDITREAAKNRLVQGISDNRRLIQALLTAADAAILVAAGLGATWIRFGSDLFTQELGLILDHPGFIAYAVIAQFILGITFNLYRPESWRTRDYVLARVAALGISLAAALALGTYLVLPWRFGRGLLALTLLLSVPLQALARFVWLGATSRPPTRRAVLIGDGPIISALREVLAERPSPPFRIVAHLPAPDSPDSSRAIADALSETDLVIVAQLAHDPTVDRLAALNFRGTQVVDAAGAYAALTGRIPVRQVDSRWFIATGDFSSLATSPFHHVQRFFDVFAATVLLVLSLPLFMLATIAILVSDGRPVFYKQVRIGRYRKPFILGKLRTMKRGSDDNGPQFPIHKDPRVLRVGRFLRRWRIDELPQLVNVLRGEMSLVGPRPERPDVADRLEKEIPFFAFRYSVRPGLTGWAQVHFPYCAEPEEHLVKIEYDLYSLRHHGPALYAIVLVRTLGALVFPPSD